MRSQRASFEGLHLHREDGGEVMDDRDPGIAGVGGTVDLAASGTEVDTAVVESVNGHGISEDVDVTVLLREALRERFPFVATGLAAVDPQLSFRNVVETVAGNWNDIDGFRFVGVDINHKAEVAGEIAADLVPLRTRVVATHNVPMLLHEQRTRPRGMKGDMVNAVADFGVGVGNELGDKAPVDGGPCFAAVVGAKSACGGDGDIDAIGILGIEENSVKAHAARAGLPLGTRTMPAESGQFVPSFAAVSGFENGGVFDAGINSVRIGERRFKVPDALEFPRVLCAVIPLVGGEGRAGCGRSVVDKLVGFALGHAAGTRGGFAGSRAGLEPGLAAIIGSLNDLAEPATSLRGVN